MKSLLDLSVESRISSIPQYKFIFLQIRKIYSHLVPASDHISSRTEDWAQFCLIKKMYLRNTQKRSRFTRMIKKCWIDNQLCSPIEIHFPQNTRRLTPRWFQGYNSATLGVSWINPSPKTCSTGKRTLCILRPWKIPNLLKPASEGVSKLCPEQLTWINISNRILMSPNMFWFNQFQKTEWSLFYSQKYIWRKFFWQSDTTL